MAWLRIDDGFVTNAKIVQLTDAQFRVWMRLLCYCTSARDPTVDAHVCREVAGLDKRRLKLFHKVGLLDKIEPTSDEVTPNLRGSYDELRPKETTDIADDFAGDFEVHDWSKYLPKDAQNAARQAKFRGRKRNSDSNAPRNAEVTLSPSHARAGTRGVPSRPQSQEQPLPEPEPLLGTTRDRHPDRNGHGTGTGSDLDQLGTEAADVLHRIPRPGAAT